MVSQTASFTNSIGDINNPISFTFGTSRTETHTESYTFTTSAYGSKTASMTLTIVYDGNDEFTITVTQTLPSHISQTNEVNSKVIGYGDATLHSSQTLLGNPLYVDLDIGEAYKIENGSSVSVNNGVVIPPELPTLQHGNNTITYDNTFTSVKVTPRWWKV